MELYKFDEPYLQRLREGDRVTQEHFIDHFGRLLRIVLRSRRLPEELQEDVYQETLLRVLLAVRTGEVGLAEQLGSYVNAEFNNVLSEYYRGKGLDNLVRFPEHSLLDDNFLQPSSSDFTIAFEGELSPEQIKGALEALAAYYRACGGVGFDTQFELEEVRVRELVNV